MIIELKGMGVQNKGAHLMLEAIQQQFKQKNVILAISWDSGGIGYNRARKLGFYYLPPSSGNKGVIFKLMKLLPKAIRRSLKIVFDKEIDIILDGSGFSYGDFWGPNKPIRRFQNVLKGKTPSSVKSILLPQALGPFENEDVKESFKKIVDKSSLIFVRDEQSMHYMVQAYGQQEKFVLAPDFTNLIDAGPKQKYPEGQICLIPNYKMFSQNEDAYIGFLVKVRQYLKSQKRGVYYLIHEGDRDKDIAVELNKKLGLNDSIVKDFDPITIKNRIKSADLVIVSRFHGLVSALSQGVPAISTSWSHKYQILMKEYGQEEALVDINNYDFEKIKRMIENYLATDKTVFQNNQKEIIHIQKVRSLKMWHLLQKNTSVKL